jgi:hypothetical protein
MLHAARNVSKLVCCTLHACVLHACALRVTCCALHAARLRAGALRAGALRNAGNAAYCGRYLFDAESRELVLHIADGKQQRYPCTQVGSTLGYGRVG